MCAKHWHDQTIKHFRCKNLKVVLVRPSKWDSLEIPNLNFLIKYALLFVLFVLKISQDKSTTP